MSRPLTNVKCVAATWLIIGAIANAVNALNLPNPLFAKVLRLLSQSYL